MIRLWKRSMAYWRRRSTPGPVCFGSSETFSDKANWASWMSDSTGKRTLTRTENQWGSAAEEAYVKFHCSTTRTMTSGDKDWTSAFAAQPWTSQPTVLKVQDATGLVVGARATGESSRGVRSVLLRARIERRRSVAAAQHCKNKSSDVLIKGSKFSKTHCVNWAQSRRESGRRSVGEKYKRKRILKHC